jgi:hypothetical protein
MQAAADAVVFLTGLPLAGGLIVDGLLALRPSEIAAGLTLALALGAPSLALAIRSRLRRRES